MGHRARPKRRTDRTGSGSPERMHPQIVLHVVFQRLVQGAEREDALMP